MSERTAKICGIKDEGALMAAVEGGASFVGFVFFEKSPRYLAPIDAAKLVVKLPTDVEAVGLFVDPSDDDLTFILEIVPLDMIQLHGKETVERVRDIKARFGRPVMKALAIETLEDLEKAAIYEGVTDWFLFDAKPPKGSDLPGGNAVSFDWSLMTSYTGKTPWMLAGGLTPDNAGQALDISGATVLDVSSGVEREKGVKDPEKIRAFMTAVQND